MSADHLQNKHTQDPGAGNEGNGDWLTSGRFTLLLAILTFVTFPGVVLGMTSFAFRDFGLFAYPAAYFQRQCFWEGELPFWNPLSSCGIPMLAQWNTMALYPPALLYLVFPLSWGLGGFCLLHLLFGGAGMYVLARKFTNDQVAGAVAGLAFSFGGVGQNFLMWPSHIAAYTWMPWVVLLAMEASRTGGRMMPMAALAGALQMLAGGPESILFTWIFAAALTVLAPMETSRRLRPLLRLGFVGLLAIGISAAQLIPFLELAAHSQRERHFSDLRSAMPSQGWANFLVPLVFGNGWEAGVFKQDGQSWTSSYYLGVGTLLLAVCGLWRARDRRLWLLAGASLAAFILSHGDKTVLYGWLQKIAPIFKVMAFPVKFVVAIAFAAPLMAAFGLARLRRSPAGPSLRELRGTAILLAGLLLAVVFWQWQSPSPANDVPAALASGVTRAGFLIATWMLTSAIVRESAHKRRIVLTMALLLLFWLDLRTHLPSQNPTTDPSVYTPGMIRSELSMNPQPAKGGTRVMLSPAADAKFDTMPVKDVRTGYLARRLGYFSNCNLLDNVPKVTGFFSLYPYEGYQISLLLYLTPTTSFPRLADFLSVSHITAPGDYTTWEPRDTFLPIVTAGQQPTFLDDTNTIAQLTRPGFDPAKTVYLPLQSQEAVSVTNQTSAHATLREFKNQRLEIETDAPETCLVVVAQTYYHRWRAYVDGRVSPLLRANYAFQAVEVPAGKHRLILSYEDRGFVLGGWISGITLTGVLLALWRSRKPAAR